MGLSKIYLNRLIAVHRSIYLSAVHSGLSRRTHAARYRLVDQAFLTHSFQHFESDVKSCGRPLY